MTPFAPGALNGRTYLVTGASSGIGRATASLIAALGGRIVATGRDTARLQESVATLDGEGHVASVATLTDADQTADWVRSQAESHGPFSGAFHAAGVELIRPARLIRQAQLQDVLAPSLFAAMGLARALSQRNALTDDASLVFMSSVAGSTGQIGLTAYSAAKAAIDGLVRSLACEMAGRRIRVNAIAAGAVRTAMHDRLTQGAGDEAGAAYEKSHLLGFGEPQDIAHAAAFLLSDASRWITGTTMVVDGGYMVR